MCNICLYVMVTLSQFPKPVSLSEEGKGTPQDQQSLRTQALVIAVRETGNDREQGLRKVTLGSFHRVSLTMGINANQSEYWVKFILPCF